MYCERTFAVLVGSIEWYMRSCR